jgi:hypothetical protein
MASTLKALGAEMEDHMGDLAAAIQYFARSYGDDVVTRYPGIVDNKSFVLAGSAAFVCCIRC